MKKESKRTEAARLLGNASAKAATPKQREARASKGGQAAQALLTHEERSRRAKLAWETRRAKQGQTAKQKGEE